MAGRPTNRDERHEQVMQALVRCVARYGLDGASLSQIAKEAGLTRPLIRHHLGNREDIIAQLADYVMACFEAQNRAMVAALPPSGGVGALLNILFSDIATSDPDMVLTFAALTARAKDDQDLREKCRASMLSFEAAIAGALQQDHPTVDGASISLAAHGIAALYFNMTSLAPLDMPNSWASQAQGVARKLLQDLDQQS